jgi:hypothetical protein
MPRARPKAKKKAPSHSRLAGELARVDHQLLGQAERLKGQIKRWERIKKNGDSTERAHAEQELAVLCETVGRIRFASFGHHDEGHLAGLRDTWQKFGGVAKEEPEKVEKARKSGGPGSRGGKGYYTVSGKWRYGEKPEKKPKEKPVETLTFDQFCVKRGVSSEPPSFPSSHRGSRHVSGASKRSMSRRVGANLADWQKQRDTLKAEYTRLVEAGKVRPPTRIERLIRTAQGNPDNSAVQAARRILGKQGIDWETQDGPAGVEKAGLAGPVYLRKGKVKGHYRTVGGKRVWVKQHEREGKKKKGEEHSLSRYLQEGKHFHITMENRKGHSLRSLTIIETNHRVLSYGTEPAPGQVAIQVYRGSRSPIRYTVAMDKVLDRVAIEEAGEILGDVTELEYEEIPAPGPQLFAWRLERFEDKIGQAKKEHGLVVSRETGQTIVQKAGAYTEEGGHHIAYSDTQMMMMHGKVMTHNHPSGYSLSDADLVFMLLSGLSEIRAVGCLPGPDGERYVYIARPPDRGNSVPYDPSNRMLRSRREALWRMMDEADELIRSELWGKINEDGMTREEADFEHSHRVSQLFAEQTGCYYERRRIE